MRRDLAAHQTRFGLGRVLMESPLIQELVAEAKAKGTREVLLTVLRARFGRVPRTLSAALRRVTNQRTLNELVVLSARCPDLATFQAQLQP